MSSSDAALTRLSQVVGNLPQIVAKNTPDGGRIGVSVRVEGDAAVIEMSDNGIGIPGERQANVSTSSLRSIAIRCAHRAGWR